MRLALAAAVLAFIPYCELGGGESEASVTVPGELGVHEKTKAETPGWEARIELERSERSVHGRGEVSYVINKNLTEQELRLVVSKGDKQDILQLAKHDEASSFKTHELKVGPKKLRVAYRLGNTPWRVVHVIRPDFAVRTTTKYEELDWAKIPDVESDFPSVYAHSDMDSAMLFKWYRDAKGEDAGIKAILDVLDRGNDFVNHESAFEFTAAGNQKFVAEVNRRARLPDQPGELYHLGWRQGAIDISKPKNLDIVEAGLKRMSVDEDAFVSFAPAITMYLKAYARQKPDMAAAQACAFYDIKPFPYPLKDGHPTQIAALAAIAHTGNCPTVVKRDDSLCGPDSTCNGRKCSPEELAQIAKKELEGPLEDDGTGYYKSRPDMVPKLKLASFAKAGRLNGLCK